MACMRKAIVMRHGAADPECMCHALCVSHVSCVLACRAGKLPGGGGEAGDVAGAGAITRAGGGVASSAARMLDLFGCAINYNRRA